MIPTQIVIKGRMQDPITNSLQSLYNEAPEIKLSRRDRLVVFSDLHVGNRRRGDDFLKNAELFMHVLERHYLGGGYTLILNGDIEEMLRFSLSEIEARWPDLYALFACFYDSKRSKLLVPCLFNSGCCIGKRGITAIELRDGEIALVHWFDKNLSQKHFDLVDEAPQQLDGSDYYRVVLNQDSLDYIFTRIRLLAE
jgi:hypothetical protein